MITAIIKSVKTIIMAQSKLIPLQQRPSYAGLGILLFLILFAGKFVVLEAIPYFGFDKEIFGRYWNYK